LRDGAIDAVRRQLGHRQRSVNALLREPNFVAPNAPGEWGDDVWTNLNSPADLEAFTSALSRPRGGGLKGTPSSQEL
jgi:hypothetical protein